ncbi:dTDP-glucose 4,6-dehydratase [Desulfitobacterium dichloroeliminans LMG P-21439]|uniref:dTDP-glucose 4,6-dehydratase n=1 Tax=Desulfitobacterium dichloroeliminans (strain LMG P-21439 / DCA1) TaxID=871963 RepID=L0F7I4_DESDL|nr:dTDP-glucose 4,6-dehydratase [Desulfitobacterium dichloroeliminans]AGA68980.1 dTDP-glucose 4,6-dehydratase [Desulfitobacterium dichloroeliminans LMG P-21439]
MRRILVTGGAGFIGSNFIQFILQTYDDWHIVNLDALTYAGNLENLKSVERHPNYKFIKGSITDYDLLESIAQRGLDGIINFAAESHVDRSIKDPGVFVETNIMGTQRLLEIVRKYKVGRFLQVSTDEVYGSLGDSGFFTEATPLKPNSPYAASKASADLLVRAYHETFGMDVVITRCSNNYGPYQFPEKLIPLIISNALDDKSLPVYGDGLNIRDWLHVIDHCSAIALAFLKGQSGEVYNIGGNNERANIEVVKSILSLLAKPESLINNVKDRLGHDRRYAIDASKIRTELGWQPEYCFETGIRETVEWYCHNRVWWEKIRSGQYRDYYSKMYAKG